MYQKFGGQIFYIRQFATLNSQRFDLSESAVCLDCLKFIFSHVGHSSLLKDILDDNDNFDVKQTATCMSPGLHTETPKL